MSHSLEWIIQPDIEVCGILQGRRLESLKEKIDYNNAKGGNAVWEIIKECDKDKFFEIQEWEIKMIVNKNFDPLIPKGCKSINSTESDTASESGSKFNKSKYYNDEFWKLEPREMDHDG